MVISAETWALIDSAVQNEELQEVIDIYENNNLKYTDRSAENVENARKDGLLHLAARHGRMDIVEFCIEEKLIDVDSGALFKETALMRAAHGKKSEHLQVVKYLLEKGANIDKISSTGYTALTRAAGDGNMQMVKLLVEEGAELNDMRHLEEHPLAEATIEGHLEVIKYLVDKGSDLNLDPKYGEYTLLKSAIYGGHLHVVQYLQEKGFSLDEQDHRGSSALMKAARLGHWDIVHYMLENGANLDVQNKSWKTELSWAASKGHVDVVIYFALRGVDVSLCTLNIKSDVMEEYLNEHWQGQQMTLPEFNVLSDILNRATGDADKIAKVNLIMNEKIAEIIENKPDFFEDSNNVFIFYRGNLYKYLIELYINQGNKDGHRKVRLLKAIYIALKSKSFCDARKTLDDHTNSVNDAICEQSVKNNVNQLENTQDCQLKDILGYELCESFTNIIRQILKDQEKYGDENTDHWLIADKIYNEYMKEGKGRAGALKSDLTECWSENKTSCVDCLQYCSERVCKPIKKCHCKCKLPRLPHKCKVRGKFAIVSCTIAVMFYMLDLITDFTVGYEDYNGFSKKLGIFEMILVVFTLLHENIRSSISLYATEEELLRINKENNT